jgi:hypothetical protein
MRVSKNANMVAANAKAARTFGARRKFQPDAGL